MKKGKSQEPEKQKLTTTAGAPVTDSQEVMTAGLCGPMLLQCIWFLEKPGYEPNSYGE